MAVENGHAADQRRTVENAGSLRGWCIAPTRADNEQIWTKDITNNPGGPAIDQPRPCRDATGGQSAGMVRREEHPAWSQSALHVGQNARRKIFDLKSMNSIPHSAASSSRSSSDASASASSASNSRRRGQRWWQGCYGRERSRHHEDDQQHEHHVDERRDVDAVHFFSPPVPWSRRIAMAHSAACGTTSGLEAIPDLAGLARSRSRTTELHDLRGCIPNQRAVMRRRARQHVVDHDCGDGGNEAERGCKQRLGDAGGHHREIRGVRLRDADEAVHDAPDRPEQADEGPRWRRSWRGYRFRAKSFAPPPFRCVPNKSFSPSARKLADSRISFAAACMSCTTGPVPLRSFSWA